MSQFMLSVPLETLQQARFAFDHADYARAALLYEHLVEQEPEEISYVWFLGLTRLLSGQEAEAQLTWMMALSEGEPEQIEQWTVELIQILEAEAERQEQAEAWNLAWAVRQHLREIDPNCLGNLLYLVRLAIKLNLFDSEFLADLELTNQLHSQPCDIDPKLLLNTALEALEHRFEQPEKDLLEAALKQVDDVQVISETVSLRSHEIRGRDKVELLELSIYLAEVGLRYEPTDAELLKTASACLERLGRYTEAIGAARRMLEVSQTPREQMVAIGFLCTRLLKTGLCWDEVQMLFERQKELIAAIAAAYEPDSETPLDTALLTFCSFYPYYLKDAPAEHRPLQNQIAALLQEDLRFQAKSVFTGGEQYFSSRKIRTERKLKIGYIARYMQQHPVGYIARWLMQYHDRERFDVYTYHLHVKDISDFTHHWFVKPVTRSAKFEDGCWAGIAKHICENDEIDILIDLDSITYTEACNVMALKPAPVQISWMGFDAPGIPAVDYYIADPHVLPESAQDYYSEIIWRLPNTYLAVDGYEVGAPTLRRDQLGIPADAVIYLSAQDGRKRHPEMMRLQIQILREVPNSYLLLKGLGDESTLKQAFT
jgi:predicted O-linked N-acetylglucosamine transferase (SPINDLY family)